MLDRRFRAHSSPSCTIVRWLSGDHSSDGSSQMLPPRMSKSAVQGSGDPLAALVLCGAHRADRVMVGGRWLVENGTIPGLDLRRPHKTPFRRRTLIALCLTNPLIVPIRCGTKDSWPWEIRHVASLCVRRFCDRLAESRCCRRRTRPRQRDRLQFISKNPDGSWTVIKKVFIPVQNVRVVEGTVFRPGTTFLGDDMTVRLSKACPNKQVAVPEPADVAQPQPPPLPGRVPLSKYADANGNIDVQRLTCGEIADASVEDSSFFPLLVQRLVLRQ